MPRKTKKHVRQQPNRSWLFWLFLCLAFGGGLFIGIRLFQRGETKNTAAPKETAEAKVPVSYAGSESCRECHSTQFELFKDSHHALAERAVDPKIDARLFEATGPIKHGSQTSEFRFHTNAGFELVSLGKTFPVERVIGVDPLRQFLVPTGNGRLQVTELAADPHRGDWFDIFGEEDRRQGEWGHWTGRGMNWNNMCATCHNTGLSKNYDEATDSYNTKFIEHGVGCEACHGPMSDHVSWQKKNLYAKNDPTLKPLSRDQAFDTCGTCHSRRAELTGNFHAGENFFDHHSLTIPDETDIYYADGQVRDEDYEFASFLGSKMHGAGVRCIDCHEPHSGKTRHKGDMLCMQCHAAPIAPAPKIDVATHSFHKAGEPGSRCVDCHMPLTTYMQRHPRHDHGFTIPDPLLTKKFGIPNACNRCHKDQSTDWAVEAVEKWYGDKMNRFTRKRAEVIAETRTNQTATAEKMMALLNTENHPYWRAVEIGLLRRWCAEPRVMTTLLANTEDTNAMVRAMSVRSLEPLASQGAPAVQRMLRKLLEDPVRSVRIEAAWALRTQIETNSVAGRDLLASMRHNSDQPSGALQLGSFYFDRDENEKALAYFRRAVQWDANSAPFHHALAVSLSAAGKSSEALDAMKAACRLAPGDAENQFKLGLAFNEAGQLHDAIAALEQAVKLDAGYARAWYNLGLCYSAMNEPLLALEKIGSAESLSAATAEYPYARATILARMGKVEEAKGALRRVLEIQPAFAGAQELLRSLDK